MTYLLLFEVLGFCFEGNKMLIDANAAPMPHDYAAWDEDFHEKTQGQARKLPQWNARIIVAGLTVSALILALGYYAGKGPVLNSSSASSNSSSVNVANKLEGELVRAFREIEALKKAVTDQNGTNQQLTMALAALQGEQNGLRQQLAILQKSSTASQKSAATTGSISPRIVPATVTAKQLQQVPINLTSARH